MKFTSGIIRAIVAAYVVIIVGTAVLISLGLPTVPSAVLVSFATCAVLVVVLRRTTRDVDR